MHSVIVHHLSIVFVEFQERQNVQLATLRRTKLTTITLICHLANSLSAVQQLNLQYKAVSDTKSEVLWM